MNRITLICFYLLMSSVIFAQTEKEQLEKMLIEATVQLYIDGWLTGDTTKVGKAMHSTCKLKYFRDGKFTEINRTDYLSRFKPTTRNPQSDGRVKMIDITGNIATAKCELETPKAVFTDYFNLIKAEDDFWYIVDKVSTRVDKN
jgi:hypothetical protein